MIYMKQVLVGGFILACLLAGCKHDREALAEKSSEKKVVTVELRDISIEVDVSSLSAIGFTMGEIKKTGGGTSIGPKVTGFGDKARVTVDGKTLVKVITALSNGSSWGARELEWEYTPASGGGGGSSQPAMLRLKEGTISVANEGEFYHGSPDWYLCGIIGGTYNPSAGEVTITPTRELKGVSDSNPVGGQFDLEVPMGFPWMKVIVQNNPGTPHPFASNHYKQVKGKRNDASAVVFKPLGAVIGYQLGNSLANSSFTPTGFSVHTDAFNHTGSFNLKTPTSGAYPSWKAVVDCDTDMRYTLSSSTPAGTLSAGQTSAYRYYAWVMPTEGTTTANTRIVLDGTATGSGAPINPFNIWKTSYTPNGTGRPSQHKTYTLRAMVNAVQPFRTSLESVTEFNLAGGRDITPATFIYPKPSSASNLIGLDGSLRFANRKPDGTVLTGTNPSNLATYKYANNLSGYYSWYVALGAIHPTYNPDGHKLLEKNMIDSDGQIRKVGERYYIPSNEEWWGIFPSGKSQTSWSLTSSDNQNLVKDYARLGNPSLGCRYYRVYGSCSYSRAVRQGYSHVIYALRFAKAPDGATPIQERWYTLETETSGINTTYEPLTDNSIAMGYKYTYVNYALPNNQPHIKVESIFLGEAGYQALPTKDASGVQAVWNSYPVTTRIFPLTGFYSPNQVTPFVSEPVSAPEVNRSMELWTTNQHYNLTHATSVSSEGNQMLAWGAQWKFLGYGVRLFHKQ